MSVICCDIDGVICDIEGRINAAVAAKFGVEQVTEKMDKFYMSERYNIDPKVMSQYIRMELFKESGFWLGHAAFKDNIEPLNEAVALGHSVYMITGRHNDARKETEQWLEKHGVICHGLLMETLGVKHKALKYLGADMMFEDRYEEAKLIASKGIKSYLIERDYNSKQYYANIGLPNLSITSDIRTALKFERILGATNEL